MANPLSLLAVEPHPDDESIGMGGTLARYSAEGVRTTLVTATRGEVGEILDKDLDPKEAAPRLATIREGELRNAVKILGVDELVFLGYEDSGMAGLPRNRERGTFWQADEEEGRSCSTSACSGRSRCGLTESVSRSRVGTSG